MSTDVSKLDRSPLPDICRNKHGGNDESEIANLKVHSRKEADKARIMQYTDFIGGYGITFKEVVKALDMLPQTASARLAELKADVKLEAKVPNQRRDGCKVFVRSRGQMRLIA